MMTNKRQEKLGIKQTIQKDWMDRVLRMLLAGMSESEIRSDLNEYLATQKQSGGIGQRGIKTYGMAIGILASWFAPDEDLIPFRNDALALARSLPPDSWLPLHWAVISASYPFWFNVALQVGRLLNLQDQLTQVQIFNRLKEQYGDRETVSRNARYVVRSYVAWGGLNDTESKGCYRRTEPIKIADGEVAILLIESSLYASKEGKGKLAVLLNSPAFFPFRLPLLRGDMIAKRTGRVEVTRYGLDDELLSLRNSVKNEQRLIMKVSSVS